MRTEDLRRLAGDLLAGLFPRLCPLCRRILLQAQEGFCSGCAQTLPIIHEPLCSRCGYPLAGPVEMESPLCACCLSRKQALPCSIVVRSVALYEKGIRKAILDAKYGGQSSVGQSLGIVLRNHYGRFFRNEGFNWILPVPLHPTRLREREFNQSVLLARPLARRLGIPLDLDSVVRIRHTPPQSACTEAERRRNLKGAFRVQRPDSVRDKSILLIDDVVTTGATLEELAQCLLSAGAGRVAALTLARSARGSPGSSFPAS